MVPECSAAHPAGLHYGAMMASTGSQRVAIWCQRVSTSPHGAALFLKNAFQIVPQGSIVGAKVVSRSPHCGALWCQNGVQIITQGCNVVPERHTSTYHSTGLHSGVKWFPDHPVGLQNKVPEQHPNLPTRLCIVCLIGLRRLVFVICSNG